MTNAERLSMFPVFPKDHIGIICNWHDRWGPRLIKAELEQEFSELEQQKIIKKVEELGICLILLKGDGSILYSTPSCVKSNSSYACKL